jgi:hypothetical protein
MSTVRKTTPLLAPILVASWAAACMAGSPEAQDVAQSGALQLLLLGLWHGVIAPVTLIDAIVNQIFPTLIPWRFGFFETAHATLLYEIGFYLGIAGGPSVLGAGFLQRRRART